VILTWMLSALLFGACVALVAASAQPFARAMRQPTRWIWVVALVVATLWPVVSTMALLLLPSLRDTAVRLSAIRVAPDRTLGIAAAGEMVQIVGRAVIALWALASLVLGVRLVRALIVLRRLRGAAERRTVEGMEVLVSDALGPATVGLRRHAVVVPRTILDLEEPLRRLLLRHEWEHRVARDPWLLLAASVAVVLFPWNAALWTIAYRLRLALEIDCDARVLAGGGDPVRYGRLLLLFARHQRAVPLALTLAAPPSHLERRIIAMRTRLARPRPLQLVGAGMLIMLGVAGACSAGAPDAPPAQHASKAAAPAVVPAEAQLREFKLDQLAEQIPGTGTLRYPTAMRSAKREGEVLAQFVVDADGMVETSTLKVLKSTDPAFTKAVAEALPTMRFTPARVKGTPVKQLVELPFTFALARH
jgi:TonB family protein